MYDTATAIGTTHITSKNNSFFGEAALFFFVLFERESRVPIFVAVNQRLIQKIFKELIKMYPTLNYLVVFTRILP